MIEDLLFGKIAMDGESVRIIIALFGTLIGAYFDIYNKRNIPNNFLLAFLALAVIANVVFFNSDLMMYALLVVGILALAGYLFYALGYVGGADVFVIASIALLLPIAPSLTEIGMNYPFILFVLIFGFITSALYLFAYFAIKLSKEKNAKPDKKYLLLVIPYLAVAYLVWNLEFVSPAFLFLLLTSLVLSVFFMTYRKAINRMMAQKIPLKKLESEDILALEFMDKELVWKHRLQRLISADELKRLKTLKIKDVMVYSKLPPFLPFVFVGLVLALLLSKYLLLIY